MNIKRKILNIITIVVILLVQTTAESVTINEKINDNLSINNNIIQNKSVILKGFFFIFAIITDFTHWQGSYHSPPHYTIEMKKAFVFGIGGKVLDIDGEKVLVMYPVCRLILKDSTVEGSFILGSGRFEFITPISKQIGFDFLFVFTVSGCVIYA